jgi:PAS domain-containing protein
VADHRDGSITDVNQAFLDPYGYTRARSSAEPRVLNRSQNTYEAMWRDILDPEKNFWKGEMINRKRRDRGPCAISINAIKGPDGEIKAFWA